MDNISQEDTKRATVQLLLINMSYNYLIWHLFKVRESFKSPQRTYNVLITQQTTKTNRVNCNCIQFSKLRILQPKTTKLTQQSGWCKSNGQRFLGRYKERYCATVTHQHVLYLFDLAPLESKGKLLNHHSKHIMFL